MALIRIVALLLCWFLGVKNTTAATAPLEIASYCLPTAQVAQMSPLTIHDWQAGVGIVQKDQPCWFRVQGVFSHGELLQFHLPGFDLTLYDQAGQRLANASQFGASEGVLLFANHAAYPVSEDHSVYYAFLEVPERLVLYKYPEISLTDTVSFSAENSRYETLVSMQCAVLLSFGFVSFVFWLLLRRVQYLLFFLMNLLNALFIFYSSGLSQTNFALGVHTINLIVVGSWIGNFFHGLLLLDLFRWDNRHSKVFALLAFANVLYLVMAGLFFIDLPSTYVLNAFGQSLWYLALFLLAWRSVRQRNWVTVIASIGMIPAIVFYWPGYVLWSFTRLARWSAEAFRSEWLSGVSLQLRQAYVELFTLLPQGAFWDTIQQLAFPALYSCSLAYHAYLLNQAVLKSASTDPLTGLANRSQLLSKTQQFLQQNQGEQSLIYALNIDRFHKINQTLGFDVGDKVLMKVASSLSEIRYAMTGRSHSDHFFQILFNHQQRQAFQQELQAAFQQPIEIDNETIDISLSVGVAVLEPNHVIRSFLHAEQALLMAQQQKQKFVEYQSTMQQSQLADLRLLSELRHALEAGHIEMFLQPKVKTATQRCHSAEALIRWRHPERGLIPPNAFIPFAESTGHITELTRCMILKAMECCAHWSAQGHPIQISVNLSAVDLSSDHLLQELPQMLEQTGARAGDLCFEITESAAMQDSGMSIQRLHQLTALGFELAIDDFGTGYSSLAYLQEMPVQELKIDRVFVRECHVSEKSRALLKTMVDMAKALHLRVVAEGVETVEEFEFAKALAVDTVQGFFLAKPVPERQLGQYLIGYS